ncbi:MAG: 7-cyano-7-deazaguanine synthase QueC [Zoogloeaceae bacterium]|jgi:7-cyano-7-deazaguanine synthase|nr:7-cyano-7-deazaguanine synthase QueC [Zoogloeaceae bacterium]
MSQKKAVILLSGGLDSATCLALARKSGFSLHCLSFDYGQRHRAELSAARQIAMKNGAAQHKILVIDVAQFGGSALTDSALSVPIDGLSAGIPSTYVPARNTILLSFALAWAETLDCRDIFIGVNAVDYSGYPDCRPEYIAAFERLANLATKAGVEGKKITIHAPLLHLSKADIIRKGYELGIDYQIAVSCYQADEAGKACGLCDACRLRREGFLRAGIPDPTSYVTLSML